MFATIPQKTHFSGQLEHEDASLRINLSVFFCLQRYPRRLTELCERCESEVHRNVDERELKMQPLERFLDHATVLSHQKAGRYVDRPRFGDIVVAGHVDVVMIHPLGGLSLLVDRFLVIIGHDHRLRAGVLGDRGLLEEAAISSPHESDASGKLVGVIRSTTARLRLDRNESDPPFRKARILQIRSDSLSLTRANNNANNDAYLFYRIYI